MKAVAAVLRTDFEQPLSGLIKLYIVMSRRARRDLRIVYFGFFSLPVCVIRILTHSE